MLLKEKENNSISEEEQQFINENTPFMKSVNKQLLKLIGNGHLLLNQFNRIVTSSLNKKYEIQLKQKSIKISGMDVAKIYRYLSVTYHDKEEAKASVQYRAIKTILDNMYSNYRYFLEILSRDVSAGHVPIMDSTINNNVVSLYLQEESYEKFKKDYIYSVLEKEEFIITEDTVFLRLVDKQLVKLIGRGHELLNQFSKLISLKHPKNYIIELRQHAYKLLRSDIEVVYRYLDNLYHEKFFVSDRDQYRTVKLALDNMWKNHKYFLDIVDRPLQPINLVSSKEENPKNLSLIMSSKNESYYKNFKKSYLREQQSQGQYLKEENNIIQDLQNGENDITLNNGDEVKIDRELCSLILRDYSGLNSPREERMYERKNFLNQNKFYLLVDKLLSL